MLKKSKKTIKFIALDGTFLNGQQVYVKDNSIDIPVPKNWSQTTRKSNK